MKTYAVVIALALLGTGNAMAQDFGFLNAQVYGRADQLSARVQAAQLQQKAKLARQVQFLQQQQLVAANAVNVHAQLGQLRALQQAQALQALHLNQIYSAQPLVAAPVVVDQHIQQQAVVQKVVKQQVCQPIQQQVCQPVFRQRVVRVRSCR